MCYYLRCGCFLDLIRKRRVEVAEGVTQNQELMLLPSTSVDDDDEKLLESQTPQELLKSGSKAIIFYACVMWFIYAGKGCMCTTLSMKILF